MKIINSTFYQEVLETHHLTIGDFYFFENILVAEIKHGVHLDMNNSRTLLKITNSFFKNRPFCHVANRVNQYSVSPLYFADFSKELFNIKSFCAVVYSNYYDEMNVEIEKYFVKKPYHISKGLEDAFFWAKSTIRLNNTASA